jgi:hypothetical protein
MSFNPYPKTERVKKEKEVGMCPCGKEPISNQHYGLGASCMFEKKHGITQKEHAKIQKTKSDERAKERQKLKPVIPSVPTKINNFSKKGAIRAKEITETKRKVIELAKENGTLCCANCGSLDYTNSHIIAVSQRPDLATDVNNITLLCLDPCHKLWGEGTIDKVIRMRNFLADVEYIYKNDDMRFNKILNKILDYEAATSDKFAASIIRAMERFR